MREQLHDLMERYADLIGRWRIEVIENEKIIIIYTEGPQSPQFKREWASLINRGWGIKYERLTD